MHMGSRYPCAVFSAAKSIQYWCPCGMYQLSLNKGLWIRRHTWAFVRICNTDSLLFCFSHIPMIIGSRYPNAVFSAAKLIQYWCPCGMHQLSSNKGLWIRRHTWAFVRICNTDSLLFCFSHIPMLMGSRYPCAVFSAAKSIQYWCPCGMYQLSFYKGLWIRRHTWAFVRICNIDSLLFCFSHIPMHMGSRYPCAVFSVAYRANIGVHVGCTNYP